MSDRNGIARIVLGCLLTFLITSLGWSLAVRDAEKERPTRGEVSRMIQTESPYTTDKKSVERTLKSLEDGQTEIKGDIRQLQADMRRLLERRREP